MLLFILGAGLVLIVPTKWLLWGGLFIGTLSLAWYFHLKRRTSYFASKGIPTPPLSGLYLGHLPEYEKDGQSHLKLVEWEKLCGDTYGIYEGSHKVIVSSDIDLVTNVLVKQFPVFRSRLLKAASVLDQEHDKTQNLFLCEGNRWKRLRALISSCLTIKQIIAIEPIINNVLDDLMKSIETKFNQNPNGVVDVKPELMQMGFSIIRRAALGIDEDFNDDSNLNEMVKAFTVADTANSWKASFFAGTQEFKSVTKYLNILSLLSVIPGILRMRKQMLKILGAREKESKQEREARPTDLIDYLTESCIDSAEIEDKDKAVLDVKVQKKLTKDELASSCMMFMIAGTDTTANSTSFLMYDLALNRDVQDKLIEEIDSMIHSDEDLTYHKIKELDLLDRAVRESGRLHPLGAGLIARRAREDCVVKKSDGSELLIENGVCFVPNLFSIQMNEKLWGPDTEKFDPDRFLPENSVNRPAVSWLAFGQGPRMCPGFKLAMHEVKLAIIRILQTYTLDVCPETRPETHMGTVLTVKSMDLKLTKRFV